MISTEVFKIVGEEVYKTLIEYSTDPYKREEFLTNFLLSDYTSLEKGAILDYAIYLFLVNIPSKWTAGELTPELEKKIALFMKHQIDHSPASVFDAAMDIVGLMETVPHRRRGRLLREFFDFIMLYDDPRLEEIVSSLPPDKVKDLNKYKDGHA